MARKSEDFSLLQRLTPGEWLSLDFLIPVELEEFFNWVKQFSSLGYKEELFDLNKEIRLHIQSAEYHPRGIVVIGGYQTSKDSKYVVPDIVAFIFTVKVAKSTYSVSASCHPIALNYFVKLLYSLVEKWTETRPSVEEYITRLRTLIEGINNEPVNKRGRISQYSQDERDATVLKWLNRKSDDTRTLDVFLIDEFGEKDESSIEPNPIVSGSTFYSWRRDYLNRDLKTKKK